MLSLHVPGDSPLHRCPAGAKVAALAVWALVVTLAPVSALTAGASVVVGVGAYLLGFGLRRGVRLLAADLRGLWVFYAVLFAAQWLFTDLPTAALTTARVLGLVLAAQVLTRTTRIAEMAGVAEAVLGPVTRIPWLGPRLARAGVRPDRVGLAMGLVLASVGHLRGLAEQIRAAQAARGVRMAPWAWVLPLLVLSLKHADDVGDALAARGID
ncbi:energy-coupling factor transporter transmembrane protein EcfT [Micrococcus porci]|uniref:energy-coupling factor transporter transmembrane component T family protein n=1 Tax=Micrococcus TaxID=1269 RepID=UPI001CCBE735|nr:MULTISPECIES: energy-coupling factor transporter transmembrane protein EcfT [Micrococcus]MCG7421673.1 energy-coupling factor transporter transmembrane protein EcfT [Micrococcus sp. ACRRV]UBH25297.1 energy-coupling factor transporter transmembrane protein EcfT [Micrococcus porci]